MGDFSGPKHKRMGVTCAQCGEMWPCDVTELREAYANRGRKLTEAKVERTRYKALAERRKKALEPFAALLQPHIERTAYEGDATGVLALNDVKITVGDLRRARAAIEEEE